MAKSLLRAAFMVSAVSLIPAATAGIAAADMTINRDIERFVSVYERVKGDYVDKVTDEQLIKGAIDGMLASLDPHSSYLDARDFKQMQITTDGNYGGLGLVVSLEDGAVKVVAPQEDSPAAKMGIKSGDFITHIDGKLLYGGTLDEAVDQMRGRPGTNIRLTIVRPGRDKAFDVTVTRQIIEIKPVKWEIKDGVGIININGFSKQTGQMTRAAVVSIEKALGHKPTGYVIDLRSNPGGLLDQAVEVSDVFLNRVEVVSQRGRDKRDIERFFAQPGDFAEGCPIWLWFKQLN
jgi:carboxyl-terminal processing protease